MNQQTKLTDFETGGESPKPEVFVDSSNIDKIIKAVARHYETVLREIGKDDCNITYYSGTLREAKWRHNTRYDISEYSDLPEHLTICGEVSDRIYDFIEKKFGHGHAVIIEGHFMGEGAKYSDDKSGNHMFVVLSDGTIIDGAYKQYQCPYGDVKRKRIRYVKPTDPEYTDYGFSATSISSSYGEDYNPKGRVKIPIEHAVISNNYSRLEITDGKGGFDLYTDGKYCNHHDMPMDPDLKEVWYEEKKREREAEAKK